MNSSISNSDMQEPSGWCGFVSTFIGSLVLLLAIVLIVFVGLDPYDSGRLALVTKPGVVIREPRLANASRGRDPSFDAAIFGNSHVEELRPDALRAATGVSFVSLIAPGSTPSDQFVFLDWFLRHRIRPAKGLVVGIDDQWCADTLLDQRTIPLWLYGESNLEYVRGLFRFGTLLQIPGRIGYLLGLRARSRSDGFLDYEPFYLKGKYGDPAIRAQTLAAGSYTGFGNRTGKFPNAERLRAVLAELPPTAGVVLLRPPVYVTALPKLDSDVVAEAACRDAFAAVAAGRPRTRLLDWRVDREENRVMDNYFELTHYRASLAVAIESDIAAALRPWM